MARNKGIVYDPPNSKKWKKEIARQILQYSRRPQLEGPLETIMVFYLKRPKSLPKKVINHIKKPDISNFVKAAEDAMEGIVYKNDSQIWKSETVKRYADELCPPGIEITIKETT